MFIKRAMLIAILLAACIALQLFTKQATMADADSANGKVTIYRDEYGIPHIYAPTHEAGLYASGWAQAEDRLEEILKNYLRGTGEMAAAFGGEDNFNEDVQ